MVHPGTLGTVTIWHNPSPSGDLDNPVEKRSILKRICVGKRSLSPKTPIGLYRIEGLEGRGTPLLGPSGDSQFRRWSI